jgi:hypothetical protein
LALTIKDQCIFQRHFYPDLVSDSRNVIIIVIIITVAFANDALPNQQHCYQCPNRTQKNVCNQQGCIGHQRIVLDDHYDDNQKDGPFGQRQEDPTQPMFLEGRRFG